MKKFSTILVISILALLLAAGSAMAYSTTYNDIYNDWPGYVTNIPNYDTNGTPKIDSMIVKTYDTTNYLESITINMTGRRVFDSLFINTDPGTANDYEDWDFYVYDKTMTESASPNPTDASFYSVGPFDPSTDYIKTTAHRYPHPVAIVGAGDDPIPTGSPLAEQSDYLKSVIWKITDSMDSGTTSDDIGYLTYNFYNQKIDMGQEDTYVIGYTPWCANDVFLTPVPEPATMLLIGTGLIGMALFGRKKYLK